MGHTLDTILPIAAAVAATIAFPGNAAWAAPLAAGATKGATDYTQTHNFGSSLKNAAGTAAGTAAGQYVGSNLFPGSAAGAGGVSAGGSTAGGAATGSVPGINAGSSLSDFFNKSVGTNLGLTTNLGQSVAGNTIGNAIGTYAPSLGQSLASTSTGSALGSIAGGTIGNNMTAPPPKLPSIPGETPWQPSQASAMGIPSSLSGISSLSPFQQATNLASTGLFGGGLGNQEQQYFGNLVNRQLVNSNGSTNDLSALAPVENTYLQKLGLGGYGASGSPNSLLQALSGWQGA